MTDAFFFAANAVLPILLMVLLGFMLKRAGLLTGEFLDAGNRLTFRVFLPVMLFINVYKIERLGDINIAFIVYGMAAVIVISLLAAAASCAFTKDGAKRGALIQAMFRSNYAIIGIPLAGSLFGEKGISAAGVMSAFCVPLFNVLSVITLTLFNGSSQRKKADVKKIIIGIIRNPLIIGTAAGLAALGIRELFVSAGIGFRLTDMTFAYKTLESLSFVCTPFALMILGGKFEFSSVPRLRREILFGTAARNAAVPLLGLTGAYLMRDSFALTGEHFASYVGVFATPTAVASAIMAKEMGADEELAAQLVVWSSLAGAVTVFVCVTVLRMLGIFG